jgi:hypothetical protein
MIEDFYKSNILDSSFDEIFYQSEYPECIDFYQPYCSDQGISDKQRLYFHWMKYGQSNSKFFKNYQDKLASTNPEQYYNSSPDVVSNDIILICNIYSKSNRYKDLLPHFLEHYTNLDIDNIIFICDESVKLYVLSLNLDIIILNKLKFIVYNDGSMSSPIGHNGTNDSIRINNIKSQTKCWYVVADLDEFHDISPYQSFKKLRDECIKTGSYFVRSVLLDRISMSYDIPKNIERYQPIIRQFPIKKNITKDIMLADSAKCILMHYKIDILAGHHSVYNAQYIKFFYQTFITNHYKWFGDTLDIEKFKMLERQKIGFDHYKEQERLLISNPFSSNTKTLLFTIVDRNYKKEALICLKNAMKYNKYSDYKSVIIDEQFQEFQFNKISFQSLPEAINRLIPDKYKSNNDIIRWYLKPVLIEYFLQSYDKVIYIDCDILFINYWNFLFDDIDGVLLTKHHRSLIPEGYQYALNFTDGFFNAGFVGSSKQGLPAINWWKKAVEWKCEKNFQAGLFDDQKYLDIMALEYNNIVKISQNKGCNIAPWNSNVIHTYRDHKKWYTIEDDSPVLFVHLTKNSYSSNELILQYYSNLLKRKKLKYDKFNSRLVELAKTR